MDADTIDLDDLPQWSPWPARLLGAAAWEPRRRTPELVQAEYDGDKYAACRAFLAHAAPGDRTPQGVRRFEYGRPFEEHLCVSEGSRLRAMTIADALDRYKAIVAETMREAIGDAGAVVELGCGYGWNLSELSSAFPGTRFLGGEYTENGVALAQDLFADVPDVEVTRFDYLSDRYDLVTEAAASGRVVVFTSHSLEQLPSARHVVERLAEHCGAIGAVFHFEPVAELDGDDLLGLLRRRYTEVNDYNRDLLSVVSEHKNIELVSSEYDRLGINPLNPTSILHWRFSG